MGRQASVLAAEPGQQVGHAVALSVPRLGLRAEARAGRHDPRHGGALLRHAADLERLVHEVARRLGLQPLGLDDAGYLVLHGVGHELAPVALDGVVALGLGRGRVDVELGVRLPEAGDLEEPLDELGLVAQLLMPI